MRYIKGYVIELEKILKYLGTTDPDDTRVDAIHCLILDAFDPDKNPIVITRRNNRDVTVILLGPDAIADDKEALEGKVLKPSPFLTQIADLLLSGPSILPYDD